MNKYLSDVEKFHKTMGLDVGNRPIVPTLNTTTLRFELIFEEFLEFVTAMGPKVSEPFMNVMKSRIDFEMNKMVDEDNVERGANLTEVLDAFCDLQYVLSGSIVSFGMQHIFDQAFEQVQRSNMSKACPTYANALETKKKYDEEYSKEGYDFTTSIKENENGYVVVRNDGKILKSTSYTPVNLKYLMK